MKIGILHLSDIHMKFDTDFNVIENKIVSSMNYYKNIDELFVVISGDLSSSGKKQEFNVVKSFVGKLLYEIGEKYGKRIYFLCVPGNHDICLKKDGRNHQDISDYYKNNRMEEMIKYEYNQMYNFFEYANTKHLYEKEKILDIKVFKFGKVKLKFNLINTAVFSTLDHYDKELHFFPKDLINRINHEDCDYSITIMHHSVEWFHESCKILLQEKILSSSEFLLTGHEHDELLVDQLVNEERIVISKCGELDIENFSGTFNFLQIDTDNNKFDFDIHCYNKNDNIFIREKKMHESPIKMKRDLIVSNKYVDDLYKEYTLNSSNFNEYFVFPRLNIENDKEKSKGNITSFSDFESILNEERIIIFKSRPKIGKTMLMKYLYNDLRRRLFPIYIDANYVKDIKFDILLKKEIMKQYNGSSNAYDKYIQKDYKEKVIFIDDFDLLTFNKSKSEIYQYLINHFGLVILTINERQWINLESQFKEECTENYLVLKIEPFVFSKRHELVNKVAKYYKVDDSKVQVINDTIDQAYSNLDYLNNYSSDFLVRFIQYIINYDEIDNIQYDNIFNILFENQLVTMLKNSSNKNETDEFWNILIIIGKELYYNHMYSLSEDKMFNIISNYNKRFRKHISLKRFADSILKSKIMKLYNDEYQFSNRTYLSFFMAKYVTEEISNFNLNPFKNVLDNICFANNDEIILFVTYFTKNIRILDYVYNAAEDLMKDWEEFDIDDLNLNILKKAKVIENKILNNINRNEVGEYREKQELVKANEIQVENNKMYDYENEDINSYSNKVIRALKYTELVSKIIPSFHAIIDAEVREVMAVSLFGYVNKLIFCILKPLDDNCEKIINDIEVIWKERYPNINFNRSIIENYFISFSTSLALSIYDMMASYVTDRNSKEILDEIDCINLTNKIFKLLIKSYSRDCAKLRIYIKEECTSKNILFKNMMLLVVHKYLITNTLNRVEEDKLLSLLQNENNVNVSKLKTNVLQKRLKELNKVS